MSTRNNRKEISGDRFGKLVALEPRCHHPRRGVIWSLRCDCGANVERSVAELNRRQKAGAEQSCRRCAETSPKRTAKARGRILAAYYARNGYLP